MLDNVDELKLYLNRISNYERKQYLSRFSLMYIYLGVNLFIAGLIDYILSFYTNFSPNFYIWLIFITAQYIMQHLISTQPMLFDVPDERTLKSSKLELVLILLMFALTLVVGAFGMQYVIAFVSIFLALIVIITTKFDNNNPKYHDKHLDYHRNWIILLILSGLLMVIIAIINVRLYTINSFIFGLTNGGYFLYLGLKQRKNLIV